MATAERILSSRLLHGVTEARGSYNRNAASQGAGGALAVPLLEKAAREIALDSGDAPIVIADYGSSQGKNSLAPIRAAIAAVRERPAGRRPVCVVHVDVAENDFSTLFGVLDTAPESYVSDHPDVFPSAVGRSFYRPVLPPGHVHLGWSSYAAVWLSRAPTLIPGHFWIPSSGGAIRAEFERQAAEDWEAFLELRARELRPGGRLVVALPSSRDLGTSPVDDGMNHINAALAEMVVDDAITADERARIILLSYPRRESELLAPFAREGRFANLVVEHCETFPVPDPAWADYQRDCDKEKLAAKHAGFFRATFMPSLASTLSPDRGAEGRQRFIDRLADRLKRRLAEEPTPLHLLVQIVVLAKEADA
jgi:SAM dependent carboxyl methyltransferase